MLVKLWFYAKLDGGSFCLFAVVSVSVQVYKDAVSFPVHICSIWSVLNNKVERLFSPMLRSAIFGIFFRK